MKRDSILRHDVQTRRLNPSACQTELEADQTTYHPNYWTLVVLGAVGLGLLGAVLKYFHVLPH